jgi:hypothetical protein
MRTATGQFSKNNSPHILAACRCKPLSFGHSIIYRSLRQLKFIRFSTLANTTHKEEYIKIGHQEKLHISSHSITSQIVTLQAMPTGTHTAQSTC